ncbi:MAG: N-acetylmuramoyl-L-alanine amidase [Ruminococcus sp.]|nr:N-acetylmuramoyl-L-alanine amidase [Ruminococcus sp.]MDE7104375.1 N-acetylmuramoyl-L-alanine amidase [Ruminococcus sp.]
MLKKIISSATGLSILCLSILTPFTVNAANFEIPVDYIIDESQLYQSTDILSPDEIPINERIKNLDESIIKIMIDPGHYSYYNKSPVYSPYWESVMTWTLSNYLQEELQTLGVHADLTKSSLDEDPTLNDRGFSSKGYDFFISMHSNASAYASMDQPIAFVYQDLPWTTIDDTSKELGQLIATKVSDTMGTNQKGAIAQRAGTDDWDRNGIVDDEWYSVLFASRFVGTPGILMEHSFHTNYNSTLWLYNNDNLRNLAKEEATIIYNYFSKIKPQEISETVFGDVNGDKIINASDASCILKEYSIVSTGGETTFSDKLKKAADINSDDIIDSADASSILAFYSYLSTGGIEIDMKKWIENN